MPDGPRTFLSAHFPLLNAGGEAYAVCGVYTDVSDIKRQEEEIRTLNASLQEKTLRQEAANAELEAFSYSVSHDLRAPLRHIAGFGKLLAQRNQGKLDEKSTHYLDVIETSVSRMGALIDDLLSFSRASKTELMTRRINTNELVAEVRAELTAQKPDHRVTWDIGPLPSMQGDPPMLRLVWVNLLSNAVKYSARSEAPRITVSHDSGVFSVCDNGAGFDMRYADKLFGVFQRLHSNQEYEGTGIGLAMVRRILERHGGRIWANATLGAGACFYFVLPGASGETSGEITAGGTTTSLAEETPPNHGTGKD
jgi:light-regulated signal transduction histidine kinase (bacteriophytochrome)